MKSKALLDRAAPVVCMPLYGEGQQTRDTNHGFQFVTAFKILNRTQARIQVYISSPFPPREQLA